MMRTELLFFLRNKACLDPHAILNPYVWQNSYFGRKHGKN
ncbi:hypothetical protein HPHPH19_1418 [Helicobacter pylori Hp H-19]|nr:hypothetical protein HPHPH19_1418 [Helicobacter pylori Hp H-19]